MTIKEMEEQIDKLNLEKLEVKMKKGRQVHFFICGDPESFDEDCEKLNLIVFDEVGHAWLLPQQKYEKGDSFNVHYGKKDASIFLNGFVMSRYPSLDLIAKGDE